MPAPGVAWIDHQYDREHDGRYARQVLTDASAFDECWGDISPVGFACVAWRLATVPALDPGYVRLHRRILTAECVRNTWDGSLILRAGLISPWPEALAGTAVWAQDRGWRDWPEMFNQFVGPSHRDLTTVPHARAVVLVDAPLPFADLPPAPDGPGPHLPELAARAVAVVARHAGDLLAPMLTRLGD
jgi:hypothetical protein